MSPLQKITFGLYLCLILLLVWGFFTREILDSAFAPRKIKKLKSKKSLKNMTFCSDLSYNRYVGKVL